MASNDPRFSMQGQNVQPVTAQVVEPRTPGLMVFDRTYRRSVAKTGHLLKTIRKNSPQRKISMIYLFIGLGLTFLSVAVGIVSAVMAHSLGVFFLVGGLSLLFSVLAFIPVFALPSSGLHAREADAVDDPRILMNNYGFSFVRDQVCKIGGVTAKYHFIDNVAFNDIIGISHFAKTGAYEIRCRSDKYVYHSIEPSMCQNPAYNLAPLPDGVNAPLPPVAPGQQIFPVQRVLFDDRIKIYDYFKGEPFKAIAQGAGLSIDECEPLAVPNNEWQFELAGREIGVGQFADADVINPAGPGSNTKGLHVLYWLMFFFAAFVIGCGLWYCVSTAEKKSAPQVRITDRLEETEWYFTKEDIDYVVAYLDEEIDGEYTYTLLFNSKETLENGEELITTYIEVTCEETGEEKSWILNKYITESALHDMGEIEIVD